MDGKPLIFPFESGLATTALIKKSRLKVVELGFEGFSN